MARFLALFVLLPAFALAVVNLKPYDQTAKRMLAKIDANGDKSLSRSEMEAIVGHADTNKDQKVTGAEFNVWVDKYLPAQKAVSQAVFKLFDTNGDNSLNKHDFDVFFNRMDANKNHSVSESEFVAYWVNIFKNLEAQG
ncbi:uncharacterized protein LOC101861691 [Aplysia californica]|uniref:Uncharacterized protein LOC101861691 n=1 Tax=Aplysia californica TaxID=6500 RepID=A0ABM0K6H3_APLCA|nr:uncharacterized protein LOC101861691 [Aplysia californica]